MVYGLIAIYRDALFPPFPDPQLRYMRQIALLLLLLIDAVNMLITSLLKSLKS